MYHLCLESLQHIPKYSNNHHQSLISYMKNKNECKLESYDKQKLKVLAYRLAQQRGERNRADYDAFTDCIKKESAETAIESMNKFIEDWAILTSNI